MASDQFGDGGTDCACAIGDARRGTIEMRCKLGVARDIRDIWRGKTGEFHQWEISRIGVISSTV